MALGASLLLASAGAEPREARGGSRRPSVNAGIPLKGSLKGPLYICIFIFMFRSIYTLYSRRYIVYGI